MKQALTILLLFASLVVLGSCQSKDTYNSYKVSIDLQGSFAKDKVEIFVDGQPFYNNVVSTDVRIGFADNKTVVLQGGNHQIKVIINNTVVQTDQFSLARDKYLGISFYVSTRKVSISYSDVAYMYL